MTEERYNNRQFERQLDQQSSDLKEHMVLLINPLTEQVKKTNGRVTRLEKALIVVITALAILGVSNPEIGKLLVLLF